MATTKQLISCAVYIELLNCIHSENFFKQRQICPEPKKIKQILILMITIVLFGGETELF